MKSTVMRFLVVLCPILMLVASAFQAQARVIKVGPGAGDEFTSIQDAVDAASSGDVLNIADGIYNEQLTIRGKDLTLSERKKNAKNFGSVTIRPTSLVPNGLAPDGSTISAFILVEDADVVLFGIAVYGGAVATISGDIVAGLAYVGPRASGTVNGGSFSITQSSVPPPTMTEMVDCFSTPIPASYRQGVSVLALHSGNVEVRAAASGGRVGVATICAGAFTSTIGFISGESIGVLAVGDGVRIERSRQERRISGGDYGVALFGNSGLIKLNTIRNSGIGVALFGDNNAVLQNEFIDVATPILDEGNNNTIR